MLLLGKIVKPQNASIEEPKVRGLFCAWRCAAWSCRHRGKRTVHNGGHRSRRVLFALVVGLFFHRICSFFCVEKTPGMLAHIAAHFSRTAIRLSREKRIGGTLACSSYAGLLFRSCMYCSCLETERAAVVFFSVARSRRSVKRNQVFICSSVLLLL